LTSNEGRVRTNGTESPGAESRTPLGDVPSEFVFITTDDNIHSENGFSFSQCRLRCSPRSVYAYWYHVCI